MTRRIQVRYENGVFVPRERPNFSEHQELTLLFDEHFPNDPPPESGAELLGWFSRHRIKLDPEAARDFAQNPEHLEQEPEDAP